MNIFHVVDFIEAQSPGFRETLVGAPQDIVRRLEKVAGQKLPPPMVDFLDVMGFDHGDLTLMNANFNAQALVSEYVIEEPGHDHRYVMLAIDDGEMGLDYFIDCRNGDDGPIVSFDYEVFPAGIRPAFRSLYEMLLFCGFLQYGVYAFPNIRRFTFRPSPQGKREALDLVEELRVLFSHTGFSSALADVPACRTLMIEGGAIAVMCFAESDLVNVTVGADEEKRLFLWSELLLDNAEVVPTSTYGS